MTAHKSFLHSSHVPRGQLGLWSGMVRGAPGAQRGGAALRPRVDREGLPGDEVVTPANGRTG